MFANRQSDNGENSRSWSIDRTGFYCLVDVVLLFLAFAGVSIWDHGQIPGIATQCKLGAVFGLVWIINTVLTRKCSRIFEIAIREVVSRLVWSALILGLAVSILLVLLQLSGLPRMHIFGTVALYLFLELAIYTIWLIRFKRFGLIRQKKDTEQPSGSVLILPLAILDFLLLIGAFLSINYVKRGTLHLTPDYWFLLQLMIGVWVVTFWLTRKFSKQVLSNYLSALEVCFKSAFLMAGFLAALIFGLDLLFYSRLQIFGTLMLMLCLEPVLFGLYFAYRITGTGKQDVVTAAEIRAMTAQENYQLPGNCPGQGITLEKPVRSSLQAGLELIQPWLFDFIDQHLDLKRVYKNRSLIVSTDDYLSLQPLAGEHGLSFLLNLHRSNDQRFLNRYFLEVHRLMKKGGYFVGKVQTYRNVRGRFKRRYSKNLSLVLSLLHFFLHRVLPKLPGTKQVYFALTKGRNRTISKAEVLGRLSFCGFEIMASEDFDDYLYFIARKTKTPSEVCDPTYGPLVTLHRTGAKGRPILVYKFRTMHPYSEFLQDYIYARNNLSPGGKIADDFRVTEWGWVMRKLWLDELPMLFNWLRGDLQLIGVRPLSRHFFSLYPSRLQELRLESKPGLLPPFYADLPETLEDICSSEERYLKDFFRAPLRTQVRYFFLTMYNIVVRGARSG
ncbi:MAG: sugar transferase [Desulfohalobiaceae bacterium]|nr:sugar transferase [Desulfohalobiaceae bacterium]